MMKKEQVTQFSISRAGSALILLSSLLSSGVMAQQIQIEELRTEYQSNPMGIDEASPRLSWKIKSEQRNTLQKSYQIRVGKDSAALIKGNQVLWDSGQQQNETSVLLPYSGPALESSTKYYWQVKIKDNHGNESPWSMVRNWHTGLLKPSDWTAQWIGTTATDTLAGPSPIFRKTFNVDNNIRTATLYITAHGIYEARINGKRVGKDYMAPGWTSYHQRLLYQTYDVSDLVKKGQNAIGFMLGDGWYRGNIGFNGQRSFYGKRLSGLAQLQITYQDGSTKTINSDGTWKFSKGPVLYSDLYNGENYDARREKAGWSLPGYSDTEWKSVSILPAGPEKLMSSIAPLARKQEEFKVLKVIRTPKGETVLDFGQNLVGWVQFRMAGKAGSVIKLEHGEVLDKEGNFYDANLRTAKQHVSYTFKGSGTETYEPHFTYQGFRYVKVTGLNGAADPAAFKAIALYADMKPTGTFSSSNPLLNQLQHNIQWGQKGNFLDVPTDCPQRDERLGWTGDAQVFFRTSAFNMDVAGFFTKWMKDVAGDQLPNGSIPFVVPNVMGADATGSAGWGDVATVVPWNMYLSYGDKDILTKQYPSMKAWVDFMQQRSKNDLWNVGFHFGDWLYFHLQDDSDGRSAVTDKYLIAQSFYAYSTQLLINAAEVLGNKADVDKYKELLGRIKKAYIKEYVTPNGRLVSGTQTAYVLALQFDLLPEDLRAHAVEQLVANIKNYGTHLTTGFLGTPYLCEVLTRFGRNDVAYELLLQETYPSWLYPVKMGATTIWERWDGIKPDGTFQTTGMNSFNHYAYGAIGDWMYRTIAGLDMDISGPGYKKINIAPQPGGKLTQAAAQLDSPYGLTGSDWSISDGKFKIKVTVPANTTAQITLPGAAAAEVLESGKAIARVEEINQVKKSGNDLVLKAGSGTYSFEYTYKL
ncbi:alpha-L-rhamnosidase [Pedobacter antarcticus 4BY]|uniref:alpha-L-rhamnosidase n=1 Tax=Pedobacter antarcticus 4BY TaxID=1358423 RepID=A0A081PBM4_9SPHI|nr:glycoside hydrolase family 78 protein [Pedobacter antarcticus]KEQ28097.1 alpha-L-rhamnosidase [Pedobacter antarcticus 4BY]